MNRVLKGFAIVISASFIAGCGETWTCETKGKTMYSISSSGQIGSADKGCSCSEIRNFELEQFGQVDEEALSRDFGC